MMIRVDNQPDPVDVYVGKRLKLRRTLLGVSQEKLAKSLGITFQQVQKYENGSNRIGASRLFHITQVLKTPIEFFFDGFEEIEDTPLKVAEEQAKVDGSDLMNKKETLDLVRSYYQITDPKVRKKFLDMLKSLS